MQVKVKRKLRNEVDEVEVVSGVGEYVDQNGNTTEVGGNLDVDGNVKVGADVLPQTSGTSDLGKPDNRFKDGNFSGNVRVAGNINATTIGDNVAQTDFIEPIEGVEISTFNCLRLGKLIFLDFRLKNETGSTINAWTNLANIKSSFRPEHAHFNPCSNENGSVITIYFDTVGRLQSGALLENGKYLHINCFYKIA